MTIRQIEYTSCDDGVEGIQGFQVRAISHQVATVLREVALRDSVYEPGSGRPSTPTTEELDRFPVAFGFTPQAPGTYAGRLDFTNGGSRSGSCALTGVGG